jgi:hypothetical protein
MNAVAIVCDCVVCMCACENSEECILLAGCSGPSESMKDAAIVAGIFQAFLAGPYGGR